MELKTVAGLLEGLVILLKEGRISVSDRIMIDCPNRIVIAEGVMKPEKDAIYLESYC